MSLPFVRHRLRLAYTVGRWADSGGLVACFPGPRRLVMPGTAEAAMLLQAFGSSFGARLAATLMAVVLTLTAHAQVPDRSESDGEYPGLVLVADQERQVVARPCLVPGQELEQNRLEWQGRLRVDKEGDYQFAVVALGEVSIQLEGDIRLATTSDTAEWMEGQRFVMLAGDRRLLIRFQSTQPRSQLNIYWRGPDFRWEPLPAARLTHHNSSLPSAESQRRTDLAWLRSWRCDACHSGRHLKAETLPTPNLRHAAAHLQSQWLLKYFAARETESTPGIESDAWRHVHGRFTPQQAQDLVAWLRSMESKDRHDRPTTATEHMGDAENGRRLLAGTGCLACHVYEQLGNGGPYSGGDLTHLSQKRSLGFVARWLDDPAAINARHRMPRFALGAQQRADLEAFLLPPDETRSTLVSNAGNVAAGRQLARQHACLRCHDGSDADEQLRSTRSELTAASDWSNSCLVANRIGQPRYGMAAAVNRRIEAWLSATRRVEASLGERLLAENNCLQCHARNGAIGFNGLVAQSLESHPDLAQTLAAAIPPALDAVGDKLHRSVLQSTISGEQNRRRPWLTTQMPNFPLKDEEVAAIADYLIGGDRVPSQAYADEAKRLQKHAVVDAATAERLVTANGFGCTSCHAIGKSRPPVETPVNQLAPNLTLLQKHIRKVWFDRWVRNPTRITPRMEMPSVQIPVENVCGGQLDRQLNAVWTTLNRKSFSPPDADPTRLILQGRTSRPALVTDVVKLNGSKMIGPLLIALPNGRNLLYDLERARLAAWWTGTAALQRTQGKTWFWEPPSQEIRETPQLPELALLNDQQVLLPQRTGQFVARLQEWKTQANSVELRYLLRFDQTAGRDVSTTRSRPLVVTERISATDQGWRRRLIVRGARSSDTIGFRIVDDSLSVNASERRGDFVLLNRQSDDTWTITVHHADDGSYDVPETSIELPIQRAPKRTLNIMPGFELVQLPLRRDVMPISLGWRPNGEMILGSLKGRVWRGHDEDGDGLPDHLLPISDDLAAPYGIHAADRWVDVVNKHSLIRLSDEDGDGTTDRHRVMASGWGHTDDYHDWVVGLPVDGQGNYYISIPCQQDSRNEAAARYRGRVLRLVPDNEQFALEEISRGHRFPMGMARSRSGELFVTDNQGNYNPFNELNHVLPGRHFGFINKLEQSSSLPADVTPPSIAIPHPWTRSVNGICFLETPEAVGGSTFGPFEGHLVGCEYDTRRLIRMSLDLVEGQYQGAAYPLAEAADDPRNGLEGPIQCAVAPNGDLYIASIRDSGWGGGNNTGSLVQARLDVASLPAGIAEVKAIPQGFRLHFTKEVDRGRAGKLQNYTCESYRRISTPAYGGDDVDRRREKLTSIHVSSDGMTVDVLLAELREGFVYEWKLSRLVSDDQEFYPAEAYYTLRRVKRGQ